MGVRVVPTWLIVVLSLGAGVAGGVALERGARIFGPRAGRAVRPLPITAAGRRVTDVRQSERDSATLAAWARAQSAESRWSPRAIARRQALNTCAVSFEIRDTTFRRLNLFHARAYDRIGDRAVVSEGYTYEPNGFARGDTVTVVLPDVWCGDLIIGGYGAAVAGPPPQTGITVR